MASEVTICNDALDHLGEGVIYSLSDESATARACARHYVPRRDALLRDHPWNFASRRADLARITAAPLFGWAYQYALPSDYIAVRAFNGVEIEKNSTEYEIATAQDGSRVLMTDDDSASIIYTRRATDASKFDPLFVEALALKIAAHLAPTITGDRDLRTRLLTEYSRLALPRARTVDANESKGRRKNVTWPIESETVNARFEYGFTR